MFTVSGCIFRTVALCDYEDVLRTFETVPGTALGVGERVDLPSPKASSISIDFDLSGGESIEVSEVQQNLAFISIFDRKCLHV